MSKKLGFTLVELMAILVVLGVILLIAMPSITNTFRNSKDTEIEEYQDTICLAAKTYAEIENGVNKNNISIKAIKDNGYIRDNIRVPESQEKYECVSISSSNQCEFKLKCN